MNFLAGEKVKHTMREREGVFVQAAAEPGYGLVDYGSGPEMVSLKYLALAFAKRTPMQHVLATDPAALLGFADEFKSKHGVVRVYGAPKYIDSVSEQLSACCSALTPTTAVDYIKVAPTDLSCGPKFSISMDSISQSLVDRLGVLVWDRTNSRSHGVKIQSKPLVEYLLREHNIIPALPCAWRGRSIK